MSKGLEALKILKATAITTSNLVKEAIEHIEEYIEEQATIIENDLEVLEILKKYINIANNGFTLCGNYYDEKDFKKEDFRKIKEWLNK